MHANDTNEAVQMLDLLLEFFADGAHWTRGRYHDGHDRHCLIDALAHLGRQHHLSIIAAMDFLRQALPRRTLGLVYFNDHRCRNFAELRSVIVKARALALGDAERERAAAAVQRWLLAEVEKERAATAAAGDHRSTRISYPHAPAEPALPGIEIAYQADLRGRPPLAPSTRAVAALAGEVVWPARRAM